MEYLVEADRDVIVEGLATFKAGDSRTFSEYDAYQFFFMRGIKLLQTSMPDGVKVTIIIKSESALTKTEEE